MSLLPHPLDSVIKCIKEDLCVEAARRTSEHVWVSCYGAYEVHPKHLVYWIVVQSDAQKKRFASDAALMGMLRGVLDKYDYPIAGRDGVFIGFESEETVKRESGGDFWAHWR